MRQEASMLNLGRWLILCIGMVYVMAAMMLLTPICYCFLRRRKYRPRGKPEEWL